ncbi:unnamed protein product [Mytilus coruscus]|uniref:B box-type domain-containing protein n=1 Tax=Mytilus coruscus TaxID=42192 RepID=A0A6J8ATB8_MYTCO|nr:unnamed protein product [Mytilus coruscus]
MTDNVVCAGCLRDNEEEITVMWCNDCEEPVCRPCGKAHRRFAIPNDVIDIKDISSVNKTMTKICKEHTGQKLIFCCVNHDKIVCHVCISESHKECDINHIEKAAKGIKDSSTIHDLKERIHKQKGIIEKVKEENNELSSKIKKDKEQQQERLIQLRSTIEDRLNLLDKNIETHYKQGVEKVSSNTEQLESLAQTTQANLQDIEKADTEESEVNLFHLVKRLDTSQLSDEENLQFLENDISNMSLQFIPENFIEKVDAMLNEFGHDAQTTSFKSHQSGTKALQSQIQVHSDEKHSLGQHQTFHAAESSKFYACCFIDENEVIVIESMEEQNDWGTVGTTLYLKAINLKDGKCNSFNISNGCSDLCKDTLCTFDRNNILIVAGDKKSVKVFDLEFKKLARTIKLNILFALCEWVTCIESQIVVFCYPYKNQKKCQIISWIDYNGQLLKTINLPDNICDLDIIENFQRRKLCDLYNFLWCDLYMLH